MLVNNLCKLPLKMFKNSKYLQWAVFIFYHLLNNVQWMEFRLNLELGSCSSTLQPSRCVLTPTIDPVSRGWRGGFRHTTQPDCPLLILCFLRPWKAPENHLETMSHDLTERKTDKNQSLKLLGPYLNLLVCKPFYMLWFLIVILVAYNFLLKAAFFKHTFLYLGRRDALSW